MNKRIFWTVVPVLAFLGLCLAWVTSEAQRQPERGGMGGMGGGGPMGQPAGRFVVAFANQTSILILDTATGQVYQGKEGDFKSLKDLPRPFEMMRPPFRDKEGRFERKGDEKREGDKERRFEKKEFDKEGKDETR